MVQIITKLVRLENIGTWDEKLANALLVMRTMRNDSTGYSPCRLLYGYKMKTPSIWPAPRNTFEEGQVVDAVVDRIKVIGSLMEDVRKEAKENFT